MQPCSPILEYGHWRRRNLRRVLAIALKFILCIVILAGLAYGVWWWAVVRPFRRFCVMLETPSRCAPSPAELREAAHATLRFYSPEPHDAFLILKDYGDRSSVPLLIRALRWQPHTPKSGRVVMVCTKGHCLDALRKLTGRDLGKNYEDWAPLLDTWSTTDDGNLLRPPVPAATRDTSETR